MQKAILPQDMSGDMIEKFTKDLPNAKIDREKGVNIILDLLNIMNEQPDKRGYNDLLKFMSNSEKRFNFLLPNPRENREDYAVIVKLDNEDKFVITSSANWVALEIYLSIFHDCGNCETSLPQDVLEEIRKQFKE